LFIKGDSLFLKAILSVLSFKVSQPKSSNKAQFVLFFEFNKVIEICLIFFDLKAVEKVAKKDTKSYEHKNDGKMFSPLSLHIYSIKLFSLRIFK
jgi:hypothetical protein